MSAHGYPPPDATRVPCLRPYQPRPCEVVPPKEPAPPPENGRGSRKLAALLMTATLGMCVSAGVDIEPPPRGRP